MFAGLADSTLSRDDGYRFMVLGRAIERVDMTVRLLLPASATVPSSPAWVTLLRSAGAHDTYLRTYRGVLDAGRVVEFMLLGPAFSAVGVLFAAVGRAQPRRAGATSAQPGRRDRGGAAPARPGAQRAGILRPGVLLESLENAWRACRRPVVNSEKRWRCSTFTPRHGSRGATPVTRPLVIETGGILMWRIRVVHSTGYAYKSPVTASYNEARLTPRSTPGRTSSSTASRPSGHQVLPLHRLLGHRGDRVRSARAAHRTEGDVVVGRGDRRPSRRRRRSPGTT